jgi:hypothetical protein
MGLIEIYYITGLSGNNNIPFSFIIATPTQPGRGGISVERSIINGKNPVGVIYQPAFYGTTGT